MIYALHYLPYQVRLETLQLTTLETIRLREDLEEIFRIKEFVDVDFNTFSTDLKGH